jgi:hypothetical protein
MDQGAVDVEKKQAFLTFYQAASHCIFGFGC